MITIRLLGGIKKIIGQDSIRVDDPVIKLSHVMDLLMKSAAQPAKLNFDNIIIAINGIDSSVLGGADASAKEGDEVTIVSIVHGGGGDTG